MRRAISGRVPEANQSQSQSYSTVCFKLRFLSFWSGCISKWRFSSVVVTLLHKLCIQQATALVSCSESTNLDSSAESILSFIAHGPGFWEHKLWKEKGTRKKQAIQMHFGNGVEVQ